MEFDAIYSHFGQATVYVGDLLNSDKVDNISGAVAGIDRPATKAFMRTDERKSPHNVYTTGEALKEAAEKAKIELSGVTSSTINLPYITADATGPKHLDVTLTRAKFNELTAHLVQDTLKPVRQPWQMPG